VHLPKSTGSVSQFLHSYIPYLLSRAILDARVGLIFDSTAQILSAFELLGKQVRDEENGDLLPSRPRPGQRYIAIPPQLEDGFTVLTRNTYPDFAVIPLKQGLDAAVYCFSQVIQTPNTAVQREIRFLVAIIYIMKAAWILEMLRTTQEFQIAAYYRSASGLEQQMDRWGMTIERFFDQFEEVGESQDDGSLNIYSPSVGAKQCIPTSSWP